MTRSGGIAAEAATARFERIAEQHPHAIALRFAGRSMSYGDLLDHSSTLARALRGRGVGPETVVGVCLSRGFHQVVAFLAVLRAGGVYFPIDRALPSRRLALMSALARPALVLAGEDTRSVLADQECPVLSPERLVSESDWDGELAPAGAGNACYVVFTSGSTGQPKGIVLTRYTLDDLVEWSRRENPRPRRATQLASVGFDVSIQEMMFTLTAGGTLVLGDEGVRHDPKRLVRLLADEEVDTANLPPALIQQVALAWAAERTPLRLRHIYAAGEELRITPEIREFASAHGIVLAQNEYGMSEAQVVTTHRMTGDPRRWPEHPPIGTAVSTADVHVLDHRLRPAAPGEVGELYVTGDAIARGYVGRPDLTAERFVACPFGAPGTRMYRTGDLGRVGDGGVIECLGRADHQVSLRGYRVELGEIDSALLAQPGVREAVTVVHDLSVDDRRVVSYVVPREAAVDVTELRRALSTALPSHMVPSAITVVDRIKLNDNGKVDRGALPPPDYSSSSGGEQRPRTPREEVVCGLFADALRVPDIGVDDDFTASGGHSLLATKLMMRVHAVFGVDIPVHDFMTRPTVATVVALLEEQEKNRSGLRAGPRPARLPLSFAQRGLLLSDELVNQDSAFNIRVTARLNGELREAALRQALTDVVERHEALRTIFLEDDEGHRQVVQPPSPVALPVIEAPSTGVAAAAARFASRGFDLTTEIPLRATLIAVDRQNHVLVLVAHHIAIDGWSIANLCDDLSTAYEARVRDERPSWRPLALQYPDFALWQDAAEGRAEDDDFWSAALMDLPQRLELPLDHAYRARRSHRVVSSAVEIGPDVRRALAELARANDATVFTVVHAALTVLLARTGAGADIPVGVPVAGRNEHEVADLVGCFVNTVVLRTDLSGDPSFRTLLGRVRDADRAALAHQDVPFERVVDLLKPVRSLTHNPLFQVMLAFNNNPPAVMRFPGVETEVEVDLGASHAEFTLDLREVEHGGATSLRGAFVFPEASCGQRTADALAERFVRLVTVLVSRPDLPVSAHELMSGEERERWEVSSVGEQRRWTTATLAELFEERVRTAPDAIAVADEHERLTYGQLDVRARTLARDLARRGAGPDQHVAIRLPRSAGYVVAVLAVIMTGATFVPVDPELPAARQEHVLEATAPVAVISSVDVGAGPPATGFAVPHDDNAAYVVFTSGTTGVPKGVVVTYGGLRNYLFWTLANRPELSGVAVLHTSTSVDMNITTLVATLLAGGEVRVADLRAGWSAGTADFLEVTPSHLPLLEQLEADLSARCGLVIGGEPLHAHSLAEWWRRRPGAVVINSYGPTEASIACVEHVVDAEALLPDGAVPIGTPVANVRAYVLDERLRPAAPEFPGELYVAGAGVARGYLHDPALTAERFVADPFGPPGSRMYRTGDIVRRSHDGVLRYVARADDQVKIRGFRIEPGEVESVLLGQEEVAQAAVVAVGHADGARLVAYVVPVPGAALDQVRVTRAAASVLPEHMVPSEVFVVEKLAFTAGGKLDRRALPAAVPATPRPRDEPRSARTRQLAEVFAQVLGVAEVGPDDNFFELGGHSLRGVRLLAELRRRWGYRLSLRDLFAAPTLARLEAWIDSSMSLEGDSVLVPLRSTGEAAPLFCVHPVTGQSWSYSGLVRRIDDRHPLYGLQSPALFDEPGAADTVESLAAHHIRLIRHIQSHGPYHLLGWSFGGLVAHEMAVQLQRAGEEVGLLAMLDSDLSPEDDEFDDDLELLAAFGVQAAELDATRVRSVAGAVRHHIRIQATHQPGVYAGDVTFFTATRHRRPHWAGADQWDEFVTGAVVDHPVPCGHFQLTQPRALDVVAAVVRPLLRS